MFTKNWAQPLLENEIKRADFIGYLLAILSKYAKVTMYNCSDSFYRGFLKNKKRPGTTFQVIFYAEFFDKLFSFVKIHKPAKFRYQIVFTCQLRVFVFPDTRPSICICRPWPPVCIYQLWLPIYNYPPRPKTLLPVRGLSLHIPTLSSQFVFVFTALAYDLYYQSGAWICIYLIIGSSSSSGSSNSSSNFVGINSTNICMTILVN